MDWAGEKNVCSAYTCPALRLLGLLDFLQAWRLLHRHAQQPDKKLRGLGGTCQAQLSNATPCKNHVMLCKNRAKRVVKPCKKLFSPATPARIRGQPKKTGPVKKEWQVGQDNDSAARNAPPWPPCVLKAQDGAVGAVAQQPSGVNKVPHHAPLVGEGLRKVRARAVQLAAAAVLAVDHFQRGSSRSPRPRATRGDVQHNVVPAPDAQVRIVAKTFGYQPGPRNNSGLPSLQQPSTKPRFNSTPSTAQHPLGREKLASPLRLAPYVVLVAPRTSEAGRCTLSLASSCCGSCRTAPAKFAHCRKACRRQLKAGRQPEPHSATCRSARQGLCLPGTFRFA